MCTTPSPLGQDYERHRSGNTENETMTTEHWQSMVTGRLQQKCITISNNNARPSTLTDIQ